MQKALTTRTFWFRTSAGLAAFAALLYIYVQVVLFLSKVLADSPVRFALGILALIVGGAVIGAVLRKPMLGYYLFVLTLPLSNLNIKLPSLTISPPNVFLMTATLGGLVHIALRPRTRAGLPHGLPSRLLLIAWMLLATFVSLGIAPNSDATSRFLVTRVGYFLTLLVTFVFVDDLEKLERVIRVAVFAACVSSAVAIAGAVFLFPDWLARSVGTYLPILNLPRTSAFDTSPHGFANWLLFALAPALMSVLNPGLFGFRRKHAIGITCLLLAGVLISQARGAWIALIATAVVALAVQAFPARREGLARPAYVVGTILFVTVFGTILFVFVIQPIISVRSVTFIQRIEEAKFAAALMQDHLLFGVGPLDDRILGTLALGIPAVDNAFLIEFASTGLLGFIPFLALWFLSARAAGKLFLDCEGQPTYCAAKTLFFSLVLQFVSVQAYVAIGEKGPWLTMGLIASLAAIAFRSRTEAEGAPIAAPEISR